MKRWANILLIASFLASLFSGGSIPNLFGEALTFASSIQSAPETAIDMPGWPIPAKPVPHNTPGRRSKSGAYTSQVQWPDENGLMRNVVINGADALAADGLDPLAGGYQLVMKDQLLRGSAIPGADQFGLETYNLSQTIQLETDSLSYFGNYSSYDIAAGDLNDDGRAEQITAWLEANPGALKIATSELPGSFGKTTSAPVAVVVTSTVKLLARGPDQALWLCHYNPSSNSCDSWKQGGGGVMLSAPAVVPLAADAFDVYAILSHETAAGIIPLVYRRNWSGSDWSGDWQLVDDAAYWPPLQSPVPAPELTPPTVVAHAGQVELFRIGSDNTLRWRHSSDGVNWGAWQNLGGALASGSAAIGLATGGVQVFFRGADDALWSRIYKSSWGNWQRLGLNGMAAGVGPASAPAAVAQGAAIDVYVRGSDDQLWTVRYNGSLWGSWSSLGGELNSAPAAVYLGKTYLFAQTASGGLQAHQTAATWAELAKGIPAQVNAFDTGVTGYKRQLETYQDFSVDLETGYFWGDGRSQIVLGYYSGGITLTVALYDISNSPSAIGFTPERVAAATVNGDGSGVGHFRITTGDFLDSNGIDDIAVVYTIGNDATTFFDEFKYRVDIYRFNPVSRSLDFVVQETVTPEGGDLPFAGTLVPASGDFDGDGQDELAVSSSWVRYVEDSYELCSTNYYWFMMDLFDVDKLPTYDLKRYRAEQGWAGDADLEAARYSVSVALAAGDFNGDGKDEIARTWPLSFYGEWESCLVWPWLKLGQSKQFYSQVQVLKLPDNPDPNDNGWPDSGYIDAGHSDSLYTISSEYSYGNRLAAGDFDRDLVDEFVFQSLYWDGDYNTQRLVTFEYRETGTQPDSYKPDTWIDEPWRWMSRLVTADFSGDSIRVGRPTYRRQNMVNSYLDVINMPPKHRDWVKDDQGVYHLVEVMTEACTPTASDPRCTHAKHATTAFTESTTSHKYQRDWGLGGGLDVVVGKVGWFVDASIKYMYGDGWENANNQITSANFTGSAAAYLHDQIVYDGVAFDAWEYPIYIDDSGAAADYLIVRFPVLANEKSPLADTTTGDYPGEPWYNARHQLYNVWSYDPVGEVRSPGYTSERSIVDLQNQGGSYGFDLSQGTTTMLITTTSTSHNASLEIGGGYTSDKDKLWPAKGGGVPTWGANFRINVKGTYASKDTNISQLTTTDKYMLSGFIGNQDTDEQFTTRIITYRSVDGYIVLDYQTDMPDAGVWKTLYNHPDPAFILPWYGFPYGSNPTPPTTPLELFSPDIQIAPSKVSVGETVEISATLRNFSNVDILKPFWVRFYLGDPAKGGLQIGQAQVASLARRDGPKTVGITWTAAGRGKQKIYAVIDPDNAINPELHDGDDAINNNVAYGNIQIGATAYADMGLAGTLPYQTVTYSQANPLVLSAYVPPQNLSEVVYFEFQDSDVNVFGVVGSPFELAAYIGENFRESQPKAGYSLKPGASSPPAVIMVAYNGSALSPTQEANLRLYRLTTSGWVEATCSGYTIMRFPESDRIAVPIDQTGVYTLAYQQPSPFSKLYLPLLRRK